MTKVLIEGISTLGSLLSSGSRLISATENNPGLSIQEMMVNISYVMHAYYLAVQNHVVSVLRLPFQFRH